MKSKKCLQTYLVQLQLRLRGRRVSLRRLRVSVWISPPMPVISRKAKCVTHSRRLRVLVRPKSKIQAHKRHRKRVQTEIIKIRGKQYIHSSIMIQSKKNVLQNLCRFQNSKKLICTWLWQFSNVFHWRSCWHRQSQISVKGASTSWKQKKMCQVQPQPERKGDEAGGADCSFYYCGGLSIDINCFFSIFC